MGVMTFQIPAWLADAARQELDRASVTGGQDNMPCLTDACVQDNRLIVARDVIESGSLQVPWPIDGVGQLVTASATLMERAVPYQLAIELARGKINQVRCQTAEWSMGPFEVPGSLKESIQTATSLFAQALMCVPSEEADAIAQNSLVQAHRAAHELTHLYIERVFELRHLRQKQLDGFLSCRLEADEPTPALTPRFLQAFNGVGIPFPWQQIEPRPRVYSWKSADRLVDWAQTSGLKIVGGPLIDFAGRNLPDWLWENDTDLASLSQLLGEHVETVVRRYQSRIRTWQISAGSNISGILASRDEELIWLTLKIAEAVRRVNPQLEVIVGLTQPWGDYLAEQERIKTPFIFADDLLRTGVKLAGLDLEFIMGVSPRGNYCRDLLETSRLLDLYAVLGIPLQATLGYPSSNAATELADPDQRVGLGWWRDGFSNEAQADWVASFAALALCKPHVRAVQWAHWSDAERHAFPHCGLIDADGGEKPALAALVKLRVEHLR
jgi:Glycosyl hydrolase family 10